MANVSATEDGSALEFRRNVYYAEPKQWALCLWELEQRSNLPITVAGAAQTVKHDNWHLLRWGCGLGPSVRPFEAACHDAVPVPQVIMP